MGAIDSFYSILANSSIDNGTLTKFAQLLDVEDAIFDTMYDDISKYVAEGAQTPAARLDILNQLKGSLDLDLEEEKAGIEKVINEIMEDDSLSLNKRKFLRDIVKNVTDAYLSVLDNPREFIDVKVDKISAYATTPTYAHSSDAGADIFAAEDVTIQPGETKLVGTGIRLGIPRGYEIQIRPRSGMSLKTKLRIANCVGTIDSAYTGEIKVIFDNIGDKPEEIHIGDKIAQLIICPSPMIIFKEETVDTNTERGEAGFGSSDA